MGLQCNSHRILLLYRHTSRKENVIVYFWCRYSSFNSKATIHKMGNVLESHDPSFVEEQQLIDKGCESRGFPIQPQDPWRAAWRKWMLLPITPHCSQALFQSPCLPFTSLEEGMMAGQSTCTCALQNARTILHTRSHFFFIRHGWYFRFCMLIQRNSHPLTWWGGWNKLPYF